jgi:hypothetical protein
MLGSDFLSSLQALAEETAIMTYAPISEIYHCVEQAGRHWLSPLPVDPVSEGWVEIGRLLEGVWQDPLCSGVQLLIVMASMSEMSKLDLPRAMDLMRRSKVKEVGWPWRTSLWHQVKRAR